MAKKNMMIDSARKHYYTMVYNEIGYNDGYYDSKILGENSRDLYL